MVHIELDDRDLAEIRFAFSPVQETALSLRILSDPSAPAIFRRWKERASRRLDGSGPTLLEALVPPRGYSPDFLTPPPVVPDPPFDDELERIRRTDPTIVRDEVAKRGRLDPTVQPVLAPLIEDTARGLDHMVEELRSYWRNAIEPYWDDLHATLRAETLQRARRLAFEGALGLFADLHTTIDVNADGTLRIDKPLERTVRPGGRGVLLVPSVFAWPDVVLAIDVPWRPTIVFPSRGIEWLGEPPRRSPDEAGLDALLGRSRARILRRLRRPQTTRDLARGLGLTPSAVSQQLGRLASAGAVNGVRVGRNVFYELTALGRTLLGPPPEA